MKNTASKKLKNALIGALVGLLIMAIFMIGPYPEGTTITQIVKAHQLFLIGSAILGAIVALLKDGNSD
ncbi:MAG: hypothetical protein BroJett025_07240 [Patescibacteria group bacterium]|nr:MAG: hypothetical protein BroJett025_07240 [Patescibacteria group bacterium]